jgi:hypothetical protein
MGALNDSNIDWQARRRDFGSEYGAVDGEYRANSKIRFDD